jgi:Dolichyl-phosphate-mannose-protein mannosyltransferase
MKDNTATEKSCHWTHWFIAPLVFLLMMLLFFPFFERFQFDTDEGINLMKAMLVVHGHSLYTEIWDDQPPLFTHILAICFRLFGLNANVGRVLVLFFSSALLWANFQFLRTVWGTSAAFAGGLLILLLPLYPKLSVSVMVGLPAVALAMFSLLALATWHKRRDRVWLILSAVALGLSVLTKVFTGFLVVVFIAGIVASGYAGVREKTTLFKRLQPALIWLLVFVAVVFVLGIIFVGANNASQLFKPHQAAAKVDSFKRMPPISTYLQQTHILLLLAFIGGLLALWSKRWLFLYPVGWLAVAYLLLSCHTPVWPHHQLLVTVPAAMLAAVGVGEVIYFIAKHRSVRAFISIRGILCAIFIVCCVVLIAVRVPKTLSKFKPNSLSVRSTSGKTLSSPQIVGKMLEYAPQTRWVITDSPMFAFRAGLLVPPNLAVISRKRIRTRRLTGENILDAMREYNPEQVWLTRLNPTSVRSYLEKHYRLIYSHSQKRLYLRNDL